MYKYLFIFEDGEVAKSKTPPTDTDIEGIGSGVLQVIEFKDGNIREFDTEEVMIDVREVTIKNTYHSFTDEE